MKIIKKLCIPLLSLVLVLSCFSVSQMDASAAMSANDHIGPRSNWGGGEHLHPPDIRYPEEKVNVDCRAPVVTPEGYSSLCRCTVYRDAPWSDSAIGPASGISGYCQNCRHHYYEHTSGGGGSNSHTHNYSTTWGAWRKISSCRLPG